MVRKLFLLALTAVAAFAFSASAASAVIVENPGMHEVEAENTIALGVHIPGSGFVPSLVCDNEWEADVSSSGGVDVHDVTLHPNHGGQVGFCNSVDDCDDNGWPGGQIEETDETSPHWPEHEFIVHLDFCLEGQGGATDGNVYSAECEINDDEAHCHDEVGEVIHPLLGHLMLEVIGEVTFHDPLGLMHEEA